MRTMVVTASISPLRGIEESIILLNIVNARLTLKSEPDSLWRMLSVPPGVEPWTKHWSIREVQQLTKVSTSERPVFIFEVV